MERRRRRRATAEAMADTAGTTPSDKVELWCGVYDMGIVFPINISLGIRVNDLKKKIVKKRRRHNVAFQVDPPLLNLFFARNETSGEWLTYDESTEDSLEKRNPRGYKKMVGSRFLVEYFTEDFQPGKDEIHVLVELPRPPSQYPEDEGRSDLWRKAFFQRGVSSDSLPPLEELAEFLRRPLPVKIRVSTEVFEKWAKLTADSQTLDNLVEANDQEQCVKIVEQMKVRIEDDPTESSDATENTCQAVWDDLIARTFTRLLGKRSGHTNRNRNYMASSGAKRPDFLLVVDDVCVFRGEEKKMGEHLKTPANELTDKLDWSYGGVPYLFGFAAAGFDVKLFAITYSSDFGARTHQLGERYQAININDRFKLMLALLNMSLLFRAIASLCPADGRGEFLTVRRESGVVVYLEPNRVIKTLPQDVFDAKGEVMFEVYNLLSSKNIHNVDVLVNKPTCMRKKRFEFAPRGIDTKPRTLAELYKAARDVLTALVQLHAASWMHRDIRWSNVMKRRDGTESWFLIDFMDAAPSPQQGKSGSYLNPDSHAPELFDADSHSTAVDIWSVGHLFMTSGVSEWLNNPDCLAYTMMLMSTSPLERPTASDALEKLTALYEAVSGSEGKKHQIMLESKENDSPLPDKKKRKTPKRKSSGVQEAKKKSNG